MRVPEISFTWKLKLLFENKSKSIPMHPSYLWPLFVPVRKQQIYSEVLSVLQSEKPRGCLSPFDLHFEVSGKTTPGISGWEFTTFEK